MSHESISEDELTSLTSDRDRIEELEKELKALKRALGIKEAAILAKLKGGASVAAGWVARCVVKVGKVSPKWRNEWKILAERLNLDIKTEESLVRGRYSPSEKEILEVSKED